MQAEQGEQGLRKSHTNGRSDCTKILSIPKPCTTQTQTRQHPEPQSHACFPKPERLKPYVGRILKFRHCHRKSHPPISCQAIQRTRAQSCSKSCTSSLFRPAIGNPLQPSLFKRIQFSASRQQTDCRPGGEGEIWVPGARRQRRMLSMQPRPVQPTGDNKSKDVGSEI